MFLRWSGWLGSCYIDQRSLEFMTFSCLYLCLSNAGIIGLPQVGQHLRFLHCHLELHLFLLLLTLSFKRVSEVQ